MVRNGVYKVRCNYKDVTAPSGYKSHQKTLKHNGQKLKEGIASKTLVDKQFRALCVMLDKKKPSSDYINESTPFFERVYDMAVGDRSRHYKVAFKLIALNIDEGFFNKKINEVLNQDYLVTLREGYQKIITAIEQGRSDKVEFPNRPITAHGVRNHFQHFKTACRKVAKAKIGGFYPINLDFIDLPQISNETKRKLATKEKFLNKDQEQLIYDAPTYQELMKGKRGRWVDTDYDVKESLIFALNCGFRQSDIAKVQWDHIRELVDENGKVHKVIYKVTDKRLTNSYAPLKPFAESWLPKKRKGSKYIFRLKENTNQRAIMLKTRYLKHLKTWCEENNRKVELDKNDRIPITYHMCRHTFVMKNLTMGGNPQDVATIIGTTQRNVDTQYSTVTDQRILRLSNTMEDLHKVHLVKKGNL